MPRATESLRTRHVCRNATNQTPQADCNVLRIRVSTKYTRSSCIEGWNLLGGAEPFVPYCLLLDFFGNPHKPRNLILPIYLAHQVTKLVGDHTNRAASKKAPGKSSAIAASSCGRPQRRRQQHERAPPKVHDGRQHEMAPEGQIDRSQHLARIFSKGRCSLTNMRTEKGTGIRTAAVETLREGDAIFRGATYLPTP